MGELLIALAAGLGFGVGVLLMVLGLWGAAPADHDRPSTLLPRVDRWRLRLGLAVGGALASLLATGWPVALLLGAVAGFVAPTLIGAKRRRQAEIDKIEAIAGWAEQLRDTIGASAGLQEAIAVTARVAPREIRPAVQELAAGMRRNRLSDQLRLFALRLDDPTADQIVVALILASERRGHNLSNLLSDVADAGRDDVTMRVRTETSRAQIYNDAKVVSGIVVGMFAFMLAFNRTYLDAFNRLEGQIVLAVIGVLWAVALYGIAQLSVVQRPPRLLQTFDAPAPGAPFGSRSEGTA